jgi:hypothetical protein
MTGTPLSACPPERRRPPLALVAAVVLAHAVLLRPTPPPAAAPAPSARPDPLWLRAIAPPPATAARAATLPPPAPATPSAQRAAPATTPRAQAVATRSPAAASATRRPPAPRQAAAPHTTTAPPETAPAPPPTTTPAVPVRLADSATLHYRVSGHARGLPFEAEAQLRWQRDSTRYEAEWTVPLPLIGTRAQHSVGAVTAAGLAPERYAERARGERAAHFDADGGRIRFSANRPDAALESGAQDRLSGVLQLGGLIAADPGRYPPGSQLSLQTAGVREADPWRWQVLDDEVLHIDGQQVPCVRLLRAPRHDWDTRIDLWLARPLGYLPARLRVTQAGGDVADQQLSRLPRSR